MEVSTQLKNGWKTASYVKHMMHKFSLRFLVWIHHQPQKYYNDSLSFYFDAFINANFDFDVSVANN